MLGDGVTAFIFAVGAGAWAYSYLMKHTNSPQNSVIGAVVVALVGFFVVFTLLKFILGW